MKKLFVFSVAIFFAIAGFSQTNNKANDNLYKGFVTPGNAAMPRVWWHWMNGNITKEGIQKDLDWMKRVGIGGFQNFDVARANYFKIKIVQNEKFYHSSSSANMPGICIVCTRIKS